MHRSEPGREDLAAAVEQAAVEGERQPVRVPDPVRAAETVLAEHVVVAEAEAPGVEEREPVLVPVRYAEVKQARLEGLGEAPPCDRDIVIEVKTPVDAEGRRGAGQGIRNVSRDFVEVVTGEVKGRPRDQVAERGADGNVHRRAQIEPCAGRDHVGVMVEARRFAVKDDVGAPVALGNARFEGYPWGDPVGIEVARGVLENLVVLDSDLEPQARNLVRDLGELTEVVRVGDPGPGVQIPQVIGVGCTGVPHLGLDSRG